MKPVCDIAADMRAFAMDMRRDASDARDPSLIYYAETIEGFSDALAAGARSAETNEDLAQSEGRQSGAKRNARTTCPECPNPGGGPGACFCD